MSHLDEGLIAELIDGELDTAARAAATAHLAACAECRARHAEALACAGESDRLIAAVELPHALRPLQSRPAPTQGHMPPRIPWRAVGWAATIVLAVGIGYSAGVPGPAARTEEEISRAPAPRPEVEVDRGAPTAATESAAAPRQAAPSPDQAVAEDAVASQELAKVQPDPATPAEPGFRSFRLAEPDRTQLPPPPAGALAAKAAQGGRAASPEAKAEGAPPAAALAASDAAAAIHISLEEAVIRLGGSIRLIDGMTPVAVRLLAAPATPAAGEGGATARVVYLDPPSRELWLDQRRISSADSAARLETGLLSGDTIGAILADGRRTLQWRDPGGFHLFLSGFLPADSLQGLARRVR